MENSFSFSDYADIHAGGSETSAMLISFPNSVSKEKLSNLEDSKIKYEQYIHY
jgi:creatinine amidohydrolase/Fe(II)-dependent formamide hydrolase-like protein